MIKNQKIKVKNQIIENKNLKNKKKRKRYIKYIVYKIYSYFFT